jgi:hypothetical protein
MGAVAGQHVEFLERARVEQVLNAFPGRQLALGVVSLDGSLGPRVQGLVFALGQFGETFGH